MKIPMPGMIPISARALNMIGNTIASMREKNTKAAAMSKTPTRWSTSPKQQLERGISLSMATNTTNRKTHSEKEGTVFIICISKLINLTASAWLQI